MDQLQAIILKVRYRIWLGLVIENIVFGTALYLAIRYSSFSLMIDFCIAAVSAIICILIIGTILSNYVNQPLKALWQAILHISPADDSLVPYPDVKKLNLGQDLITNLTGQLYQFARITENKLLNEKSTSKGLEHEFIANSLPLPLFVLNDSEEIVFVNSTAASYIGIERKDLIGKNIYMVLDMAFASNDTFDSWLKQVKQKVATASKTWERVRLSIRDNHPTLLFDLAAYYNKENVDGNCTFLVIFDHTKQYSQDDQAVSFIALSVHELRTPITLLRGYIEVFQQELNDQLTPELQDFMNKMKASSEQLMAFVNNILNVARVDDDQLELRLKEEDWAEVLVKAIDTISLRAKVRGIKLQYKIQQNLPKVAIDRLSVQEVINNLIDNAIKYSGNSKVVDIESRLNGEDLIETTVKDYGVGIPTSIIANLFTKFYRDHRNRAQIGGTGLGLYLSKAIVSAHGGNLWVKSKVGQGSTFGFTLLPYSKLSSDQKKGDNESIIRSAHGWIKNHSYYRR